ncbi:MAG: hypothetical protein QXK94_00075 [Candidatus Jordarchaeales archaeon]
MREEFFVLILSAPSPYIYFLEWIRRSIKLNLRDNRLVEALIMEG